MRDREVVTVPATLDGVREAVARFEAFAAAHALARGQVWPFQVALDEVLANIVTHGYAGAADAPSIEIAMAYGDGQVELVIVDAARPFNPLEAQEPDVTAALEERPIGGLGIALVRKLMEAVEYERQGDRNRLRLRGRLMEA
ncbi:MAG TPA: ATP-binding protein [Vicinamibacteria bacterium]|nr:ATP-binding protein [Vicinamibacteria bacterium]